MLALFFIELSLNHPQQLEPASAAQPLNVVPEPSLIYSFNHPTHIDLSFTPLTSNTFIRFTSKHLMITKAKFGICTPKTCLKATQDIEPPSVNTALTNQKWYIVMKDKFDAPFRNYTWTLVLSNSTTMVVGDKWVFRVKYNLDKSIFKYKA